MGQLKTFVSEGVYMIEEYPSLKISKAKLTTKATQEKLNDVFDDIDEHIKIAEITKQII